jgi:GTP-binding protein Era
MIREQVLRCLEQEVPHAIAVVVEEFKERENGALYIAANIYTEKNSQKGIVIGQRGNMLREIGRLARRDLQAFFGRRVYLDLWVKVRKNWRKNDRDLREFGYDPREFR